MKLKFLFALLFFTVFTWAQKGSVSGVILDAEYDNEPLPFANVTIKETVQGASTDDMGKYSISLKPGSYTLVIAFVGYDTKEIPFTLKAGEHKVINHTLVAGGVQLEDVVITHSVTKESEEALLQEQQKAVEIKQAIGAEEISKKGIGDVAAAVAKTTGVTKQEGSGNVYVRGLGDRYNTTTMNGLPLPSNNPSRKNIALEIFSTDMVEFIGIDKTFSYKNYGDFAGANIDIVSKNYKGKGFVEAGIGANVNSNAISEDQFYLQDGPSKFGFSNQSYPSNPFTSYNFSTSWDKKTHTPIGTSLFIRGGKSYNIGEISKLSFFLNASFDNGYSFKEGVARGSVNVQGLTKKDLYSKKYSYNTNTNLMGNINYKLNNKNNIRWNGMYINSTSQKHEEYTGVIDIFDLAPEGGGFVRRSTFDRTSLVVNQLLGEHTLSDKINFDWGLSYNMINNYVPDRMQNTFIPVDDTNPNGPITLAVLNSGDNHRYYQEMTDDEVAANTNFSYQFKKNEDDEYKGKLNVGFSGRSKKINFDVTQFNFDINQSIIQPTIDLDNIDAYFNNTSLSNNFFEIETFNGGLGNANALTPQNFNGTQTIAAAFVGVEYQFTPKLFLIIGVRGENIAQEIAYKTALKPAGGKNKFDTFEFLPALSGKYEITDNQNIKFATSKTYTLPQFKERAPFLFEEVNQAFFGNPYLYNSTDYNFDIKWEWFPKRGEVVSLTAFGKLIQNPINEVTVSSASNDISWVNSGEKATGIGAELEVRKNILSTTNSSLSSGLNISYLHTNQDLDANKVISETNSTISVSFSDKESTLTGASDWLINADISYNNEFENGGAITTTLAYAYFSERVNAIGSYGKGNLIDSKVGTLDFIFKYKINKKMSIGYSLKNITNPKIERYQEKQNVVVDSYSKGIYNSLSFKYSF